MCLIDAQVERLRALVDEYHGASSDSQRAVVGAMVVGTVDALLNPDGDEQ
ncbi:MAG: hypothetical protein AB7I38_18010 [Dehalococcoidia bacterium]